MKIHDCKAYEAVPIAASELISPDGALDIYPEAAKRFFTVRLSNGTLTLGAKGFVGHIPLNDDNAVRVESRVPLGDNLRTLLAVAGMAGTPTNAFREAGSDWEWQDSLFDIYADALLDQLDIIRGRGLLREYTQRNATTSFPKGRVLIGPTIRRHHTRGQPQRAENAWFERTVDVPVNRCIKYAIWACARYYQSAERPRDRRPRARFDTRRVRLNAAYAGLGGVALDERQRFLADPLVRREVPLPGPRDYYELGLNVAVALARRDAVAADDAEGARLPAMVVDLESVFERYLLHALQLHARREAWSEAILNGNEKPGLRPLFSRPDRKNIATPDILIQDANGAPKLIIEVKCVPETQDVSHRDAINQAITYAECYGIRDVVVAHPRAASFGPVGMNHQGRIGEVDLHMYRFDLAAPDLLVEDARFADALRTLM